MAQQLSIGLSFTKPPSLRRRRDTRIRTRAIAAEDIEVRYEEAVNVLKEWIAALAQCAISPISMASHE